jgi:hypothetical protein
MPCKLARRTGSTFGVNSASRTGQLPGAPGPGCTAPTSIRAA